MKLSEIKHEYSIWSIRLFYFEKLKNEWYLWPSFRVKFIKNFMYHEAYLTLSLLFLIFSFNTCITFKIEKPKIF